MLLARSTLPTQVWADSEELQWKCDGSTTQPAGRRLEHPRDADSEPGLIGVFNTAQTQRMAAEARVVALERQLSEQDKDQSKVLEPLSAVHEQLDIRGLSALSVRSDACRSPCGAFGHMCGDVQGLLSCSESATLGCNCDGCCASSLLAPPPHHRLLEDASCPVPNGAYVNGMLLIDGDFNERNVPPDTTPRPR